MPVLFPSSQGKVIVVPRSQLAELAKREEARRTGVYCLVGPDPDSPVKDRVYVGEGDNVLTRLTTHHNDEAKDFWTRAAIVISKDQNQTKAHGRYLESRLVQMAQQAGRASSANGTAPAPPPLPEPDLADMEYFLEQVQMMLPVLGFGFLQPKASTGAGSGMVGSGSPDFVLTVKGGLARAREIAGEFVVLRGSQARREGITWTSYNASRICFDASMTSDFEPVAMVMPNTSSTASSDRTTSYFTALRPWRSVHRP